MAKNTLPAPDSEFSAESAPAVHTLLYMEDNPSDLKLVERIIARHPDFRLLTAMTGKSGIEIARGSLPDVILTDINLSDMSGFKALKTLRSDSATARIPVIAVSVNSTPLNVESGLEEGFFRYLVKPIKLEEFMDALESALAFAEEAAAKRRDANAQKLAAPTH